MQHSESDKVFIASWLTARNARNVQISMVDLFNGIKKGTWRTLVESGRSVRSNVKKYTAAKAKAPSVWLQELPYMVFDWEGAEVTIPEEYILAKFKSFGGEDYAVVVKIPVADADYRRKLQEYYGIESNKAQIANDRPRVVSYDPKIQINWSSKVLLLPQISHGVVTNTDTFVMPEEPLDNGTALSVYAHYRTTGMSPDEAQRSLEGFKFHSKSLRTKELRKRYYDKWEEEYSVGWDVVTPPVDVPEEQTEYYCTQEELERVVLQTALSPFLPLKIFWHDSYFSVCSSTVLNGSAASGKSFLTKVTKKIEKLVPDLIFQLRTREVNRMMDSLMAENIKQAEKMVPNVSPVMEFESSNAAILGSLSVCRSMLLCGGELDSLVSSMRSDHNEGRSAMLRKLIEGEGGIKTLKKNDAMGRSQFFLEDPRFSMLVAGTPSVVGKFFSRNIENGLAGRILFLSLPKANIRNPWTIKVPEVTPYITPEQILQVSEMNFEDGTEVQYNKKLALEKLYEVSDRYTEDWAIRSVRDCVKRAAVQLWIDGERKRFKIPDKELQWQFRVMEKSLEFMDSLREYETDNFGNNRTEAKIEQGVKLLLGKTVMIQNGIKVSKSTVEKIKELYRNDHSIKAIAEALGCTRNTVYKCLKQ